ncbi:MAG TPA: Fur family transcriptional regulator [Candidatus Marinimicrobia bacterium]|jgi:Fur family ferric uptake transcriptional regulator|nr:Fur family transcriptional regulator [Candidatus Neomarinimicrobiota bacterium]HJM84456.1 Fur family transcriptional regulator [Candidatus Neomarinimicrobiota bacterium]
MTNNKLLSDFKDALRKEGLKITPQRIAVLEEIIKNKGHRESEDVYMAIKTRKTHVSRATVYRTLDILVQNGFARKLNLGDGRARYEPKIDSPHHDHMICNNCGKIIEFVNHEIEKIQEEIAKHHQFKLQQHIHQLFGICKECQ